MSTPRREKRIAIRAGLFVTLGLMIFGLVVLLIGKEKRLFAPQVTYHAWFENVDGLKRDSPVWLGGLEVGRVTAITFSPDLGDKRIDVQMELGARFASRIRADSVARLASRGILGDKAVDITLGSTDAPQLAVGGEIKSGSSGDLSSLLKASGEIVDNLIAITRDVRSAAGNYADPTLAKNLSRLVGGLSDIVTEIDHGDGTLHGLIYDRQENRDVRQLIARASGAAGRLEASADQVDALLAQVRTGDGAAHALLYDRQAAHAITQLGQAATELAAIIHDAKTSPNGAVHQLVYGDASDLFANLGAAAADIKKITGTIAAGDGTVGALIQDPTVYDDLRTVLGNVKRNRILRALVRYSISNGENLDRVGKPESAPAVGPTAEKR